jgi:hypothetical protein
MNRSDWDETTICGACAIDVHCDDVIIMTEGPWKGKELCPDCYDEHLEEIRQ